MFGHNFWLFSSDYFTQMAYINQGNTSQWQYSLDSRTIGDYAIVIEETSMENHDIWSNIMVSLVLAFRKPPLGWLGLCFVVISIQSFSVSYYKSIWYNAGLLVTLQCNAPAIDMQFYSSRTNLVATVFMPKMYLKLFPVNCMWNQLPQQPPL